MTLSQYHYIQGCPNNYHCLKLTFLTYNNFFWDNTCIHHLGYRTYIQVQYLIGDSTGYITSL